MYVFVGWKICKQHRFFSLPVSRVNLVQTRLLHRFPAGSSQTGTVRTMVSMETGKWFPRKAGDLPLKHPAGCCHYVAGELWVRDSCFSFFLPFSFWVHTESASCHDIISSASTRAALIPRVGTRRGTFDFHSWIFHCKSINQLICADIVA